MKNTISIAIVIILLIGLLFGVWRNPSHCCEAASGTCPAGQSCSVPSKPVIRVTRELSVGEATFFDFNRPEVRAEAQAALDGRIVSKLRDISNVAVNIDGFADPIGRERSEEYNRLLSLHRAESVADVITHKRPSNGYGPGCSDAEVEMHDKSGEDKKKVRLCIHGFGSTKSEPEIEKLCRGKAGQALRECYQPLRRVDVQITGELNQETGK
jgi:outer membrane protein OmpA-like peptidoglycan-associated protein